MGSSSVRALEPFGTKRQGHNSGALRALGFKNYIRNLCALTPEQGPWHWSRTGDYHPWSLILNLHKKPPTTRSLHSKSPRKCKGSFKNPFNRIESHPATMPQPYGSNPHWCQGHTGTLRNFLGLACEAVPELLGTWNLKKQFRLAHLEPNYRYSQKASQ